MWSKPAAHLLRAQLPTPAPMPGTREKMSTHNPQSGGEGAARPILVLPASGSARPHLQSSGPFFAPRVTKRRAISKLPREKGGQGWTV